MYVTLFIHPNTVQYFDLTAHYVQNNVNRLHTLPTAFLANPNKVRPQLTRISGTLLYN